MNNAGITFEPSSGQYDSNAKLFSFNAYDGDGHVICAISAEAFETLSGTLHLDPASADVVFVSWEASVFDVARAKYDASRLQDGEALVIEAGDIATRH